MRARYYSPELRRFVNADIVAGSLGNAVTLNRFAYANGNPVSFVDPFGLSAERGNRAWNAFYNTYTLCSNLNNDVSMYRFLQDSAKYGFYTKRAGDYLIIKGARSPVALSKGVNGTRYAIKNADNYWDVFRNVNVKVGLKSEFSLKTPKGKINGGAILNYAGIAIDTVDGIVQNIEDGTRPQKIVSDAIVDVGTGVGVVAASTAIGSAVGSVIPVAGNIIGAGIGFVSGIVIDWAVNADFIAGKSIVDWTKEGLGWVADRAIDAGEWVADTAIDVWNATTDFVEDAGDWIAETASDAWDATTGFFEDVGGFFCELFA